MQTLSKNLKIHIETNESLTETLKLIVDEIKNHHRLIYLGSRLTLPLFIELPKKAIFPCLAYNEYTAKLTVEHNNASVILIDTDLVGKNLIPNIIKRYQESQYEGGRHQPRIDFITNGGIAHENYNG